MQRLAVLLILLSACAADVGKGRTSATVAETPVAEASVAIADPLAIQGTTILTVDPARSRLGGIGAKITEQHPFTFTTFEGRVGLDGDEPRSVAFKAEVSSIQAEPPRLLEHLKKEDFLWVDHFPEATFVSTAIHRGSEVAGMTHTVTGDLTVRGQTKRLTFPAKIEVGAKEVTAGSEFVINRQDFGVTYPGKPDNLVQDNVVLQIAFVAPRSGA